MVPEIWEEEYRVLSYNSDPDGRASLPALYAFLLESAGDHATAGGFGFKEMWSRGWIWVLTRFKLLVERYPRFGEKIKVETWAKGRDGLFYTRDYFLEDPAGSILGRATSSWAVLSSTTHRPETKDIFIGDFPQIPDRNALEEKLEKLPPVEAPDRITEYRVRSSDIDFNRHVNSMRYVEWILNGLDEETRFGRVFKSMEVNYLAETTLGDEVEVRVSGPDDASRIISAAVSVKGTDKDAVRARFEVSGSRLSESG